MRWCLAFLVFLARVAGCDGDAPTLSARVERVGALTFVVAMNVSASGEVDIVATRASEYPDWASASAPPSLVDLRAAVAPGGAISTATDPPPAYFRRTVRVPARSCGQTRALVRGAYNLQRPERSGAYGDFVVYPGASYVVAVAPRDDDGGTAQVTALEVVTAASVSSDASLSAVRRRRLGHRRRVVDAAASATLAPAFPGAGDVTRYEASVDAEAEEVTVFALPAAGAAFGVEVDGSAACAKAGALRRRRTRRRVQRRARACFLRQERADYGDGYRGGPRHDAHVRGERDPLEVERSASGRAGASVGAGVFYGAGVFASFVRARRERVARHRVRARVRG